MKKNRIGVGVVALAAASALVLTGCSSGGSSSTPTSSANLSAVITANGSEPQNPLIPTNTQETGGGRIVDSIFAGLVYYDATGKPINDAADSITTTDSQTFTIKLKANQTFSDGTPVTSNSFVKAWQYGALLSNAQLNQSFFAPIEGYSATADSPLTGLTVVDDTTFTVKLSAPQADFPLELGYDAFYPLPDSAYANMTAYGTDPIGNGPYKLASPTAWQHNVQIDLVPNTSYTGGRKVQNGGLTIKFYADLGAAYADLQGNNLDVLDSIPSADLATFQNDLGSRAVNEPTAVFQSFTIPGRDAHFSGQEGQLRRQALSESIDRDTITKVIFNGTRTPASDFTSPVINGWTDSLSGASSLKYNPDDAKKLWAEADAISPWSGTFQIGYNADGDHQAWVDAVSNSIKNTLGIDASGAPVPTFAAFRTSVTDKSINTAFRTGWQADYPGLSDFLVPLYSTSGSSNDGQYSNPAVDALFTKASAETSTDAANQDYQDAQNILLKDLPAIPLWYSNITGGYGTSVSNVSFGWNSEPLYYAITKS
ncbi:peptide ABC transporter substrate-binding protein [Subtercola lobariae]|uniref:ABC transporter substrate-binding protein n=1 Tax=Subtercola lobariae TaxID=1588641 RepID=A0A917B6C8_9MICO|nr:ABC transporter substrate-binding protein [Subtercola lobariae]GGF26953.1 ABC transporter substrate-binding protein [Subtercola lobariae]